MMEKQARIKTAAAGLKKAIVAAVREQTENLKTASHNNECGYGARERGKSIVRRLLQS